MFACSLSWSVKPTWAKFRELVSWDWGPHNYPEIPFVLLPTVWLLPRASYFFAYEVFLSAGLCAKTYVTHQLQTSIYFLHYRAWLLGAPRWHAELHSEIRSTLVVLEVVINKLMNLPFGGFFWITINSSKTGKHYVNLIVRNRYLEELHVTSALTRMHVLAICSHMGASLQRLQGFLSKLESNTQKLSHRNSYIKELCVISLS